MATIDNDIRTRPGICPVHGRVTAEKQVPKLKFPFMVSVPARTAATMRPYRCPDCGAKA
jgi:hypothetical protein